MPTRQTQLARIIDDLSENGFAICDGFLPERLVKSLADEAQQRFVSGDMLAAKTGKHTNAHKPEIRGDSIFWLDESLAKPSIQAYFSAMHEVKEALNQQLLMNVHELETHLARYPVGAGYLKHLDQFQQTGNSQNQARQLSSVLYLNADWQAADGGELRLYLQEDEFLDILPTAGKLVLFLSAKFWHEVLPAKRDRISLTGWYRTRELIFK
jgi:SM-20-related protein